MKAEEVIGLIPDSILDSLAVETKVDCFVKKLSGKLIFKLFLYTVVDCKRLSLRIMETVFHSFQFRQLFQVEEKDIKHSGIGMRIAKIKYEYFQKIFEYLIASVMVTEILFANKKINLRKIDSTLVVLSSKLLKIGLDNNVGKKDLKYSVEVNHGIPVNIMLRTEQKYLSENLALPEVIKRKRAQTALNIALFDRGVHKKQTFVELTKNQIFFISRLTNQTYEVVQNHPFEQTETATLTIVSDQTIRFKNEKETLATEFRLVVGISKETKQAISFISNVTFLTAVEITELYRARWEIETFFKFIKQELNFSHLLSRNENGIKVVMYLTMIAAILLTIYKKTNRIVGWVVTKIKFVDELYSNAIAELKKEIKTLIQNGSVSFVAKTSDG